VHVAQAQVIEQADRVAGVQLHGRGHAEVVPGFPDAAVVEQDHLVALGETAGQVMVVIVAEGAPATHAQHRVALTQHFVIHVVAVDAGNGHSSHSGGGCPGWGRGDHSTALADW
jgi:hypothetical protein